MQERSDTRPTMTKDTYPPPEPPPPPYRPERLVKPRVPKPYPDSAPEPEPRKVLDQRTLFRVRVLPAADGMVRENRVLKAGTIVELPVTVASQFVRLGHAEWTCMVRAIGNNISAGDYVLMAGDIAPCAPDRAGMLAARGLVELVPENTPTTLGKAVVA